MNFDGERVESILLEYARDKIAVVESDGEFRYVNDASRSILGYEPEDLVGEQAFDYVHPGDRQRTRAIFERVIESDEPTTETVRYRFRSADGSWVWLESRFSNLTDETLGGYVVASRDIMRQLEDERERDRLKTRLREITDAVSDVVWMYSGDWEELLFMNPAYEEVYGEPIEPLRKDTERLFDAIHPDDVPCVKAAMERLSNGAPVDLEYRVDPDGGYDTYVWVQGEPIVRDGEVVRVVGFARDVTDRRRRERQLAVMDNLLRHNLRNDLSIILGHAELIAREADEPLARRAEIIRRQGRDLLVSAEKQRTIIELLTEDPLPERLDVNAVLATAVEQVRDRYPEVTVETTVPSAVEVVALHELKTALIELLENAIRHDPNDAPEVSVVVRTTDEHAIVEVHDSAPPIPEEEYHVLTGNREMNSVYHSTGLGLWLVYWTIDLSGGDIDFTRSEDVGNTITITLPRATR